MRFRRLGPTSLVLALLWVLPVAAQRSPLVESDPDDEGRLPVRRTTLERPNLDRIQPVEAEMPAPPVPDGAPAAIPGLQPDASPAPPAPEWMINPRVDFAFLPQWAQKRNASVGEIDFSAPMQIPLGGDYSPLRIVPVVAQRFWAGPKPVPGSTLPHADVPGALYEFYADIRWRPRIFEWLFLDMRFSPGFYTDFNNTSSDGFLPRGSIAGIFAFSEQFQLVLGAAATNRVISQLVPVGGFIYTPDPDTEFRLVFPVPRAAVVIDQRGDTKYWLHLTGEWGGGAWAVERQAGFRDTLDYSDARVYVGIESQTNSIVTWHAEIGFVFDRQLSYKSDFPERFRLGETFIARVGFSY